METLTVQHTDEAILASKARLPAHVVYRTFVKETVVLNLKTCKYHGLNRTAGRMLDVLQHAPAVRKAVEILAAEYDRPLEEMENDVTGFCRDLLGRGLIELAGDGSH
jgi:hypothetical protein